MKNTQIWAVVFLLGLTALFLHRRGDTDRVPPSRPLEDIPLTLGVWRGQDQPISQEALDILGKGVFLNRLYEPVTAGQVSSQSLSDRAPVSLFIGYFPTQRTGSTIHSPQNCLPGAGWTFDSSGVTSMPVPSGKPLQVGDYQISNGVVKEEVLYWYQTHGRAIANDYTAKLYLMADSIRNNRSDAALVRVITPIQKGEDRDVARARAVTFAQQFTPTLSAYIPD